MANDLHINIKISISHVEISKTFIKIPLFMQRFVALFIAICGTISYNESHVD